MKHSKRAFTLIELVISIVLLGVLAATAIVGYIAVVNRGNDAAVETTARSVAMNMNTNAAFDADIGYQDLGTYAAVTLTDMPADVYLYKITGAAGSAIAEPAASATPTETFIVVRRDRWACIDFDNTIGNPGSTPDVLGEPAVVTDGADAGIIPGDTASELTLPATMSSTSCS